MKNQSSRIIFQNCDVMFGVGEDILLLLILYFNIGKAHGFSPLNSIICFKFFFEIKLKLKLNINTEFLQ